MQIVSLFLLYVAGCFTNGVSVITMVICLSIGAVPHLITVLVTMATETVSYYMILLQCTIIGITKIDYN